MKFACDRCQTRYSISDEKVQGKVLKIRCKTCGNIIVLREQGAESAPAQAAASTPSAAALGARGPAPRTEVDFNRPAAPSTTSGRSRADVDWFVAVKGKQHGPLKREQVIELLRNGTVHDRSYCWNEDLPGWTRLRELPDFAEAAAQVAANPPPPMPPPPPSDDEPGGAQVLSLDAHRERRGAPAPTASPTPAVGGVPHDPFAAVTGGVPGVAGQTDTSAPRESTRVFIMNAGLHNRGRKHKTYAAIAVACVVGVVALGYLDYAGHVQIPLLSNVVSYTLEKSGVEAPRKRQLLAKFNSDEPMDPELECKLLGNCVRAEAQRAARRRAGGSATGATGGVSDLNLDDAFGNSGGTPTQAFGPDGKPIDPGMANPDVENQIRAQLGGGLGKPMTSVNASKLAVEDRIAVANTSGPDMEQVMKVVKQNVGSVKPCVESALKNGQNVPGKQKLLVLIKQNGTVGGAKIMDGAVNATPLGECVVKAAKKWKFPPQGQEFEVEVPLILSGG